MRAISSAEIGATLPYSVYSGFIDMQEESPSVSPSPSMADEPDLSAGPSFFYGVQWWFFALLALGFIGYFARSEYRERKRSRTDA